MRLAGLNIEGAMANAAIVNRLPGRTTFVRATSFAFTPGDDAQRATELRAALTTLRDEDGVRAVVAGIGMTHFSHHYVVLPLTKRSDIIHALNFELEKHLPLPPDEYVFDFIAVSQGEDGTRLLVLAALRNKLAWITQAVKEAGLLLTGIRCTAIEAMNEFASSNEADGVLFIHRGHDAINMFGMKDTAPEDIRVLRRDSRPPLDVKEMFEKYSKGVFSSYEAEGAEFAGLDSFVLNMDLPQILALSAFKKRRFDMQFAPEGSGSTRPLWHEHAPSIMGVLCLLVFLLTSLVAYYKDSSALRQLNAKIEAAEKQSLPLMEVKKELTAINGRKKLLTNFRSNSSRHILALRELSEKLPRTAWLTSLSIDEQGKVSIQGFAVRASDIIRPLDSSRLFKSVEFTSPVTISNNRERFTISMEMEK